MQNVVPKLSRDAGSTALARSATRLARMARSLTGLLGLSADELATLGRRRDRL